MGKKAYVPNAYVSVKVPLWLKDLLQEVCIRTGQTMTTTIKIAILDKAEKEIGPDFRMLREQAIQRYTLGERE